MKKFLSLASLILATALSASGQGTAFTYQGRLNDGTNAANGFYDFKFSLYDTNTLGNLIGQPLTYFTVGLTNGSFSLSIDFGPGIFTGANRFLQLAVRTNGASAFTNLSPREALLPTPYAIYAGSAGTSSSVSNAAITASALNTVAAPTNGQVLSYTGSGLSWTTPAPNSGLTLPYSGSASSSGSLFTLTNTGSGSAGAFLGKVGIGTTAPNELLEIAGMGRAFFGNGAGSFRRGLLIDGQSSGSYARLEAYDYGAGVGLPLVLNSQGGNIGIGTTTPAARLDVVTSSGNAEAVSGTSTYSGVYGQLGLSYTYPSGEFPPTAYCGVYGNGNVASTFQNAPYPNSFAGYFDGPVNVNGQVAASSIRSVGASINSGTFAFTQQAVSGNTFGNGTMIYNSLCDGDPNAILIITHNWSADTNSTSKFNTKPVGVYYNSSVSHWVVLNEDNSTMALGRAFNVMIIKP